MVENTSAAGPTRLAHLHGKDPGPKPGDAYPLACHLLDTIVVADNLWATRVRRGLIARLAALRTADGTLGEGRAKATYLYACALHDVGKANPFFQYQERVEGSSRKWAGALRQHLALPATDPHTASALRQNSKHPLRRHEYLTAHALSGHWPNGHTPVADRYWLATVTGGHHGFWRPMSSEAEQTADCLLAGGWVEHQADLVALLSSVVEGLTGVAVADIPPLLSRDAAIAAIAFTGMVIQADWIASSDERVAQGKALFVGGLDPTVGKEHALRWVQARREEFASHIDLSLGAPATFTTEAMQGAVLGKYAPRPLQAQAMTLPEPESGGLWVVMYPTGDGKTEAAGLRHALVPDEGMIFGLPTRATTDAMENRLSKWFAALGSDVIKSHQFAELPESAVPSDSDDESCGDGACGSALWYTTALRKLAAPNLVATCDQVLSGALRQRHVAMRLFHLANHHVVLDEVHTYDTYQTELLIELLHWWGATGTRVTLLSATLPRDHMTKMVAAYRAGAGVTDEAVPETTFPGSLFAPADPGQQTRAVAPAPTEPGEGRAIPAVEVRPHRVSSREERIESHVQWARNTARLHPSSPIGIVSNTVKDCTAIATALAADPSVRATHDVICLHSTMVNIHRSLSEGSLLRRVGQDAHARGFDGTSPETRPVVVVGTQVIQASLDIDFDFLASDLAPAPDLIQRLGRQWRFETGSTASPERLARTGRPHRQFPLVAVTGDPTATDGSEDALTYGGAMPYLVSPLQNTWFWAVRRGCGPMDVVSESQSWVDQAYDRRLLGEIAPDLTAEDAKHVIEALNSKARIGSSKDGVLREPRGPALKRPKDASWADLEALTAFNADEATMRTRFIDYEKQAVLLFDSAGLVPVLGVDKDGRKVKIPGMPEGLESLPPNEATKMLDFSVRVSGSLAANVEEAARRTLGKGAGWRLSDWDPKAKVLGSTPPVDIKYLPSAAYSALTGLHVAEEDA